MHAMIWCHGHKQAWTASLMHSTLFYVGYTDVVERAPGESTHIPLQGVEGHGKVIGEEFNALESMCFEAVKPGRTAAVTAPDNNLLPRDLNVDYDATFYNMHVSWHSEYERIAELLIAMMPFDSAVDFGCGNGYIVQHLARKGKIVLGIDGSENVLKHYPDALIRDLTQPLDVGQHDLVICTEVAEHIEEKYADTLVETVCRASRDWVFFSAAKAGYGGHLHVNEQERPYWYEKFAKHGFVVQHDISNEICNVLGQLNKQTWWFANNCFVMRRQRRIAIVVGDAECVSTM
jgi:SAM-dependent methyltransferase